jgi:histidine ammonia-lyase
VEEAVARVRALVPPLQHDRPLHPDIAALAGAVHDGRFAV